MDEANIIYKTIMAEVYRLEAHTRAALQRNIKVLNMLEKHKEEHDY
jgi:hypothetical protein